jgi:hypothetical protein
MLYFIDIIYVIIFLNPTVNFAIQLFGKELLKILYY